MGVRIFVFCTKPSDRYLAGRTSRSLLNAGLSAQSLDDLPLPSILDRIRLDQGPMLLVRAGAWLARAGELKFPNPSATDRPLCALGTLRLPPDCRDNNEAEANQWRLLLKASGGDFNANQSPRNEFPTPVIAYLDENAAVALEVIWRKRASLIAAMREAFALNDWRVVHYSPLDVYSDPSLRVIQLITSLQQGGAERVTLNLAARLPSLDVSPSVITLGKATRASLPTPDGTIDLSNIGDVDAACEEINKQTLKFGADLIHSHLIGDAYIRNISRSGVPLIATVHNMKPGWPPGLSRSQRNELSLLVACSQAVEADLKKSETSVPIRTVWNGIDFDLFQRTPELVAAGRKSRMRLKCAASDFVLIALANPRPQKRLNLLPGILAATRAEFNRQQIGRSVHLMIVGEISRGNPASDEIVEEVWREALRLGVSACVHWLNGVADVPCILAAANVLVSTSAYEGLSMAQLEALSMDLPVVATDVGGIREIAWGNPAVFVLPPDAVPEQFALVLAELAVKSVKGRNEAARWFTHHQMARCYRWLYPRAIAAAERPRGRGLLLVTNNFSTGGAQSSARRLLVGLASRGVDVRAAVLQEQPRFPTPGRQALTEAGVRVIATRSVENTDAADVTAELLAAIDTSPPEAVLLWNVVPACKILLADALLHARIFDISPGEMFFHSLERYFAQPIPWLPYRTPRDYGARLAGVVVKYRAEMNRANEALGTNVHVIPNGVDISPMPAPASRRSSDLLVIGTVARLSPQKRLEDLLEALRLAHPRLPPYVLRVAGTTERGCEEYVIKLRRSAEGLPVEWCGEVHDVSSFLHGLDLFAMISEPAGCPNASLEAMAAGLPIILTDVGGASEQVEENITGRLIPPRNPAALADALVEVATASELRQRFGIASRQKVENRFSLDRMIAGYQELIWGGTSPAPS